MSIVINNETEFPLELVKMNQILFTMLCDIYGIGESMDELREMIKQDLEDDPEKKNDIYIDKEWDARLVEWLIEFSKYHLLEPLEINNDELPSWDADFMARVEAVNPEYCGHLFQLANFMQNDPLIDVCAIYFAEKINGLSTDEIRKQYGIKNDFTEEEEKEIAERTAWIEQHK